GLVAGLLVLLEDDDLRVLTAELDDAADVGVELLDGEGDRVDLLNELGAEGRAERGGARAGHEDAPLFARALRKLLLHDLDELEDLLGLLGRVTLVVAPEDLEGLGVEDDGLHRRRADIDPNDDGRRARAGHSSPPVD